MSPVRIASAALEVVDGSWHCLLIENRGIVRLFSLDANISSTSDMRTSPPLHAYGKVECRFGSLGQS